MDKDRDIQIMGIVNMTPDSYHAPSRGNVSQLLSGADIIDVGGVSTRPGAPDVSEDEEWGRLEPFLSSLPGDVSLSIDTFRSGIVRKAHAILGRRFIVNDISAGEDDPAMLDTVASLSLGYVAMHKRGNPRTMQSMCDYGDDITSAVLDYFDSFAQRARSAGVEDWILDPGFGFAKTVEQNYELLRNLGQFRRFGRPVLVGVSRKSMICKPLGITHEEALSATQVVHLHALKCGADILRVHDVREARQTVALYRLLENGLDFKS